MTVRFKWTDHCSCQGHPNWWWKREMQKCSLWFFEHTWCSVPHQVFPCVANCICLLCGSLRTCTSALNFTFLPCMFFQTISIYHQFPAVLKHFLKPWLFIFMCCYLHSFILPSAGSRSGSPGRVLTTTTLSTMNTGVQRVLVNPATAQKRSKIPRSQGCSREASPSRLSVGKNW